MTSSGRVLLVVEELLFAYAAYVVLFDIFFGWWEHVHPDRFQEHLNLLIFVFVFIIVLIMCQVCFIVTAATNPGYISVTMVDHSMANFKQSGDNVEYHSSKRSCKTCLIPKPDRAHHCRRCNKCVLKMDHHCFFVNNCIGFYNYKYFFNFLCWMMAFCILVLVIVVYDGIVLAGGNEYKRFTALAAGILCLATLVFVFRLFYFHCKFILYGLTTIEHEEKKLTGGHLYDLGKKRNCLEIFGKNPLGWCLPFWSSSGNGTTFETRQQTETVSLLTTLRI